MRFIRRRWNNAETVRQLFDENYYRSTYDDLADPRLDPFVHFMDYGWREGRNPAKNFNTLYYRDKHLNGDRENPLTHYVTKGKALKLPTLPLDNDDFINVQSAVSTGYFSESDYRINSGYNGDNALAFYLKYGWKGPTPPSFYFDPEDYLRANAYVSKLEVSPFYHSVSQSRLLGETMPFCSDVLTYPAAENLVESVAPSSAILKPPAITELEPIPPAVRATIEPIWATTHISGGRISTYHFTNVYVAAEGLVFSSDGQLIDVTRTHHTSREIGETALAVRRLAKAGCPRTIDRGVLTESRGAQNYGHFILEMLPRAWYARAHLKSDWPALIRGGGSPMEDVSRQALGSVGYASNEIISVGPEPVFLRDLIFVDGLARHALHISATALELFDELMRQVPPASIEQVYAPRGSGVVRDFEDEAAVAASLGTLGFERTPTATMTFEEQVALFQGAREVVGVTGAALTNILFCRPGARVTVFSPASAVEVLFWAIAERRGLDYREVRCQEVGPQRGLLPWDRSIRISTSDLLRLAG